MMINIKKFSIFLSFLVMIFVFSGTASAANLTVNPGDSIQSTINMASNNDIITVNDDNGTAYTYNENIVINKKVSLQAKTGASVSIKALKPSKPTITVNPFKKNVTIKGFTITGAERSSGIYLTLNSNCHITGNSIINNNNGIYLVGSNNNLIQNNTLINNDNGINIGSLSNNNKIKNNTIVTNINGIKDTLSTSNKIQGNTIVSNDIGINLHFASANINFNRITNNNAYGLYCMTIGTVDATNNWWGTNNPNKSSKKPSDIYVALGNVKYNPWLVLNVKSGSLLNNLTVSIIADLTHNNHNNDTSQLGNIPDGIPIKFNATLGTIDSLKSTKNGKTIVTLSRNPLTSTVTVSAFLDNQMVNYTFEIPGLLDLLTYEINELNNLTPDSDYLTAKNDVTMVEDVLAQLKSFGYEYDLVLLDDNRIELVISGTELDSMSAAGNRLIAAGGGFYGIMLDVAWGAFNGIFIMRAYMVEEDKYICPDCQKKIFTREIALQLIGPNWINLPFAKWGLDRAPKSVLDQIFEKSLNMPFDWIVDRMTDDADPECNTPYCPFSSPDITVTIDAPNPAYVNEECIINVTVHNNGVLDTEGFSVIFDMPNNSQIFRIKSLDKKSSVTFQFNWVPPSLGVYHFSAYADCIMVDPWGEVFEKSEKNNHAVVRVNVIGPIIRCTLIDTISYPSTSDPNQPYKVTFIYQSEEPVYLNPRSRTPIFVFKTTDPVYSPDGFQAGYPWGAGRLYVGDSPDGPWSVVFINPYFICKEGVTEYEIPHWAMGVGYYEYFRIDMYNTYYPWPSGIVKTFMSDFWMILN